MSASTECHYSDVVGWFWTVIPFTLLVETRRLAKGSCIQGWELREIWDPYVFEKSPCRDNR
jgi:hypothetical protein